MLKSSGAYSTRGVILRNFIYEGSRVLCRESLLAFVENPRTPVFIRGEGRFGRRPKAND